MGLFRLPLFFFLSGVFFFPSQSASRFLYKKTDGLLKPYFSTLFVLLFVSIVIGRTGLVYQMLGIFYGNGKTILWVPMWFLTHLWLVSVLAFFFVNVSKIDLVNPYLQTILILFLFISGPLLLKTFWRIPLSFFGFDFTLLGLPFSSDVVPISMAFFFSGFFMKKRVTNFVPLPYLTLLFFALLTGITLFTDATVNLNARNYKEPLFATLAAFSGIYCVLSLSYYICKTTVIKRILTISGASSLFILIFHWVIENKSYKFLMWFFDKDFQFPICLFSFLLCVALPVLMRKLFSKSVILRFFYFPNHTREFPPTQEKRSAKQMEIPN